MLELVSSTRAAIIGRAVARHTVQPMKAEVKGAYGPYGRQATLAYHFCATPCASASVAKRQFLATRIAPLPEYKISYRQPSQYRLAFGYGDEAGAFSCQSPPVGDHVSTPPRIGSD